LARSVRLYELGDLEAAEVASGRRPVDFDLLDARHSRTLVGGPLELFEVSATPFRDELDDPVIPVGHPAGEAQRLGATDQEEAEADPLDVALDDPVKPLGFHPSSIVPRMGSSSIVAIGDELVGGFTLDTNSSWLAERLRILGYPVKRISAIRDRPKEIVDQVRRELDDLEVTNVFCSGGLGPTPDDRTFASLAEALGRELIVWDETRQRIERRVRRMHEAGLLDSPEVTEGNLRMARIPADPAYVFKNRRGMAPGVLYEANGKHLFVLPGVPLELKGIFTEEIEPEFLAEGSAATVREVRFTFAVEARFYPLMRELEESFPDVSVGSYPNFETKELVIRCLGTDPKRVDQVVEIVRRRSAQLGMNGESRR
jgi:molybdenum cofactor synthesis domain-containing protein